MGDGKRQMRLYLISVLGICWVLGIAAAFTRGNVIYQILQKGFTAFPVIAAVLTRRITKDKAQWRISLKVWKDNRLWAFCAFVPGILIAVGAALYFMLFPEQYSGIFHLGNLTGTERVLQITNPLQFGLICILIAAVCIPVQLLELGEEIGWREYLLPKQISMYGARKGILLNGLFWGTAHLPLICLGFNYSPEKTDCWDRIPPGWSVCQGWCCARRHCSYGFPG